MKIINLEKLLPISCVVLFLVSLIFYLIFSSETQKIFIYESINSDDQLYFEARHIPKEPVQGDIAYFVDELLLGPITARYRPLFGPNTKVLFCFIGADKTLYINLSEEALFQKENSSETFISYELLKKNILTNYNTIDNVIIFMMGNRVYDYSVKKSMNL